MEGENFEQYKPLGFKDFFKVIFQFMINMFILIYQMILELQMLSLSCLSYWLRSYLQFVLVYIKPRLLKIFSIIIQYTTAWTERILTVWGCSSLGWSRGTGSCRSRSPPQRCRQSW